MILYVILVLSNTNASIAAKESLMDKQTVLHYHLKKPLSQLKYARYSFLLRKHIIKLLKIKSLT